MDEVLELPTPGGITPIAYLRRDASPALPAPDFATGPFAWAQKNLFPNVQSSIVSVLFGSVILWALYSLASLFFFRAIFSAPDGALCRAQDAGICWPFLWQKLSFFTYFAYPEDQRWRVNLAMIMGAVLIVWLLWDRLPGKAIAAGLFFLVYPVVGFWLLYGFELIGLPRVDTNEWGGIFVSLMLSLIGIVFSLPLGIILALGRRSQLPIVKMMSVVYIEVLRGVPFITVLFMAVHMLPLFVPEAWHPNKMLLPLIGTVMFASAYMAEVVRGGLQAMPKGQFEGAMAMGLGYWQMMRLIILPQSLTIVIPGIVNTFIGLFKDTTLVQIVGFYDFLGAVTTSVKDLNWAGPNLLLTGLAFAALFYWVFCYSMASYSKYIEHKLNASKAH